MQRCPALHIRMIPRWFPVHVTLEVMVGDPLSQIPADSSPDILRDIEPIMIIMLRGDRELQLQLLLVPDQLLQVLEILPESPPNQDMIFLKVVLHSGEKADFTEHPHTVRLPPRSRPCATVMFPAFKHGLMFHTRNPGHSACGAHDSIVRSISGWIPPQTRLCRSNLPSGVFQIDLACLLPFPYPEYLRTLCRSRQDQSTVRCRYLFENNNHTAPRTSKSRQTPVVSMSVRNPIIPVS